MAHKDFGGWSVAKLALELSKSERYFYEREIWWVSIGHNIGSEEDGKGASYSRPVLIFRKFNQSLFYGLPLSTTSRTGKYYFGITTLGIDDKVLLTQMRAYDAKRLINKIGVLTSTEHALIKRKFMVIISGSRRENIEPPLSRG
jgi:mRNA interferase MazF